MQKLSEFIRNDVVDTAEQFDHCVLTVEHACFAMLGDNMMIDLLTEMGVDTDSVFRAFVSFLEGNRTQGSFHRANIEPDELLQHVIALTIGKAVGTITMSNASVLDLFLNILKLPPDSCYSAHVLNKSGLTLENTSRFLAERQYETFRKTDIKENIVKKEEVAPAPEATGPYKTVKEAEDYVLKFATNLNSEAALGRIDPLIGRDDEIANVVQVLMRRRKNNPLLIGEAGVGKTSIAEGLALRIVTGNVPTGFLNKVIYSLDVGALVAGTRYRGDFEERVRNLLIALAMIPHAVVFIDEIHLIVDGGKVSSGSMDASNLLKPALAKGTIRCIGATTYDDYRKTLERDRALLRRFKKITISQPTPDQAKSIILGLRPQYEAFHGVTYTVGAVSAAVDLVVKYFRDAMLPDKAIDLIDDAGARQMLSDVRKSIIDKTDIEREVSLITEIPLSTIQASAGQAILNLERSIGQRVFGQNLAITKVTNVIKIARAGLRRTNKPEGMFLFVGPTGVGKTELARALADDLNIKLIKYDMSEYMEKHSVSRLIGSPPGYVGHGESGAGSGLLINDVEQNPRCVLLLDEVEKAHADVFNILLQVMDDARLTNGNGKVVDFRNVVLVMTSNAGAAQMSKASIGFRKTGEHLVRHDDAAIRKFFPPEFINRLDGVVPFSSLSIEHLESVTRKFMHDVSASLLERGVSLSVTDDLITWLTHKGHDPIMGARPIERMIDTEVRLPLADLILGENVREGYSIALALSTENELTIQVLSPPLKELESV